MKKNYYQYLKKKITMKQDEKIEASAKIAEQHAIEFAKWCLRNVKKAASGKKYVFKNQTKVVADEHTIGELYKVFLIDKQYDF